MKTRQTTWTAMMVPIVALILAAGCSNETGTTTGTEANLENAADQTINLDEEFGGFNAAFEDPAFGDDSLVEATLLEEEIADGLGGLSEAERAAAEELNSGSNTEFYSFTVVWGNLDERDTDQADLSPQADPVDWAGSLDFEGGVIRVASLISFDRPEDHLIEPRRGRGELAWASTTHGGFDGIRVTLIVPAADETQIERPVLQFTALPLEGEILEYTLEELEELDELHDVTASGEQVSIRAFKATTAASLAGFMGGRWGFVLVDSTTTEGDRILVRGFKGRWVSADGATLGYMRGHYGFNRGGRPVFFGKYIDVHGYFRGYLHGVWRIETAHGTEGSEDYYEVGTFDGQWSGAQGGALGRLQGHWSRRGRRPGTFSGLWRGVRLVEE